MKRCILLLFFLLAFCFTTVSEARNFALLVGVNEYSNVPSLNCCVNDINAIKNALIEIGFAEEDIQILVTGGSLRDFPTKENIERKVAEILALAKPTDMVFFAFSGHGAREDTTDYFCPPFVNPEKLADTCVSITKVMEDLANCNAQFKWMVVDACRSNVITRQEKTLHFNTDAPNGIAFLQSCSEGEKCYEERNNSGNGYFTKNLVAALSGKADANHDGYVTLLEVCSWTSVNTKADVKKYENKDQSPYFKVATTDFPLNSRPISMENQNLVVPDDIATIEEAYSKVKDGGVITIQPGKYELSKTLEVNRPVTFRGSTGRAEDVVIDCPSSDAFVISSGSPTFERLTFSSAADNCDGVDVTGGTPKFSHCIFTSRKGIGLGVTGENANPRVENCIVKNCNVNGLVVIKKGRGEFVECEVYGNGAPGIGVSESANPTFTKCKVYNGKSCGVVVCDNALGSFNECEIYNNTLTGIVVYGSANPTFNKCKIHSGKECGVYVYENGLGSFTNCEIYENLASGITVKTSGDPKFTGCKIHDGKQGGVWITEGGKGTFNNNTLENNYTDGKLDNWDIRSDSGEVKGSGNAPEFNLPPDTKNLVVPDSYASIEEAYAKVEDGGVITIKPGKYKLSDTIVVNRSVTFRGSTEKAEDVVIDCPSAVAFKITGGSPVFQNLTATSETEQGSGFLITSGTPKILRCVVTAPNGCGMLIKGENANPLVESCVFKSCKVTGVLVSDNARGTFTSCDFYENEIAGFGVAKSANPTVTKCKFHDGDAVGVTAFDNGQGSFNNCEIYGNKKSGVELFSSGNPTFIECSIHDNKVNGALVYEKARGEFRKCDIFNNEKLGFEVYDSGNPIVTECKIHDGKSCGVAVYDNGRGEFRYCEIYENEMSGFEVYESGSPIVTECKIHDGKSAGILIYDRGRGEYSKCKIFSNTKSGIEVRDFGNPIVTGCSIYSGKGGGVYVHRNGKGTFNKNTLENNYTNGEPDDWDIRPDAGSVNGSGNSPEFSPREVIDGSVIDKLP